MAVARQKKSSAGSADHRPRIVANHHGYDGGLRGDILDRHGEHHTAGVVEGQQVGTGVARFQRHHGFLRSWNQMEDREAVDGAGSCELRRTHQHRRGLRTRSVENQRSVRSQRPVKRRGQQRPRHRRRSRRPRWKSYRQ